MTEYKLITEIAEFTGRSSSLNVDTFNNGTMYPSLVAIINGTNSIKDKATAICDFINVTYARENLNTVKQLLTIYM
jgi:hypothetical protein